MEPYYKLFRTKKTLICYIYIFFLSLQSPKFRFSSLQYSLLSLVNLHTGRVTEDASTLTGGARPAGLIFINLTSSSKRKEYVKRKKSPSLPPCPSVSFKTMTPFTDSCSGAMIWLKYLPLLGHQLRFSFFVMGRVNGWQQTYLHTIKPVRLWRQLVKDAHGSE